MTVDDRIRGRVLQRIRAAHLSRYPLCVHCAANGRDTVATQVDHIKALVNGGVDSLDAFVNRQSLCDDCHATKTAADLGYTRTPAIGADGYPKDDR